MLVEVVIAPLLLAACRKQMKAEDAAKDKLDASKCEAAILDAEMTAVQQDLAAVQKQIAVGEARLSFRLFIASQIK